MFLIQEAEGQKKKWRKKHQQDIRYFIHSPLLRSLFFVLPPRNKTQPRHRRHDTRHTTHDTRSTQHAANHVHAKERRTSRTPRLRESRLLIPRTWFRRRKPLPLPPPSNPVSKRDGKIPPFPSPSADFFPPPHRHSTPTAQTFQRKDKTSTLSFLRGIFHLLRLSLSLLNSLSLSLLNVSPFLFP